MKILDKLPDWTIELLKKIGVIGDRLRFKIYIVGGIIRDLLIGVESLDIDLVIVGDIKLFCEHIKDTFANNFKEYKTNEQFKTAKLIFKDDFKIDVARARKEKYPIIGSLPVVEKTNNIRDDLARRDFTINAMAVQINANSFGKFIDYFGGEYDLKKKLINVIHKESFLDDPTRIIKAINFALRYNFTLSKTVKILIKEALQRNVFSYISIARLKNELIALLNEADAVKALQLLKNYSILKNISGAFSIEFRLNKKIINLLKRIKKIILCEKPDIEVWLLYFLALLEDYSYVELEEKIKNWHLTNSQMRAIIAAKLHATHHLITLLRKRNLLNSQLYEELKDIPTVVLFYLMAKVNNNICEKRIIYFLNFLAKQKIQLTGNELVKLGLPPGPIYKQIKEELLHKKIDEPSRFKNLEDEIEYVKQRFLSSFN